MGFLSKLFSRPKPPSKHDFAKAILAGIEQAGETGELVYDDEQFAIRAAQADDRLLSLGNGYPEYLAAADSARPQIVRKWVRLWFTRREQMPDDFEGARPDVLPTVQARSHYELVDLQFQLDGRGRSNRPYVVFGEHFAMGLVYDLPESMRHVTHEDLDHWDVTLYEAMETARQNLAERPAAFLGPEQGDGLWCSMAKDSYDAARLLLVDCVRNLRVRGDMVAMIPNREELLVTGADDLHGLEGMLKLATESLQRPRSISGLALRLDGEEWVPWLPAEDHPLYADFRQLRTMTVGQEYTYQKGLLDQLHQQTDLDVFVASFSAIRRGEGSELVSYCLWADGVSTWLPRTDLVRFVAERMPMVTVPWQRAVEVVGEMMEPMGMYPERWRVSQYPSEQQLAAMGADTPSD